MSRTSALVYEAWKKQMKIKDMTTSEHFGAHIEPGGGNMATIAIQIRVRRRRDKKRANLIADLRFLNALVDSRVRFQ
jgi:hypothetical protein